MAVNFQNPNLKTESINDIGIGHNGAYKLFRDANLLNLLQVSW
jgi:hypothetical protein